MSENKVDFKLKNNGHLLTFFDLSQTERATVCLLKLVVNATMLGSGVLLYTHQSMHIFTVEPGASLVYVVV